MKRLAIDLLVLLGLIVAASFYMSHEALRRFDFYDMGSFLDAGYRVWRGQKIYVDFFYIAGPLHPYLHAIFFSLFGFTKTAVLVHLCVFQAISLTVVYFIARRYLHAVWASAIVVLVCLSMYGPIAHPWYDQNAMTFFLLASAAFLWGHPLKGMLRNWILPAIAGGMMALSFLTKTNVGVSAGTVLLFGYLLSGRREKNYLPAIAYVISGGIVLSAFIFTLASPAAYFDQNFFAFSTGDRMLDFDKLDRLMANQPLWPMAIAGALIVAIAGLKWADKNRPLVVLFVATWLCGVFSGWTSSTIPRAYCFFLGLGMLYLCAMVGTLPAGEGPSSLECRLRRAGRVSAWIAIAFLMMLSYDRALTVWSWQLNDLDSSYTLQTPAFAGWHCSQAVGGGVDESVKYISANVPQGDSLLVLPDAPIIYGLTGHDSYRKFPWAINIDNSPGAHGSLRRPMIDHFNADPPKWLLLREENRVGIIATQEFLDGLGLWKSITENYQPVWRWEKFVLCKRLPAGESATRPSVIFEP